MFKVNNYTLAFNVVGDYYYWIQEIELDDRIQLESIFIENIKKGNLSVTNKVVVDTLKRRLLSYLGTMHEIT